MHKFCMQLLISTPSLGVYYCQQLTLSVCPDVPLSGCLSVTPLQIASFLFLNGIQPFLTVNSQCGTLQNCFSSIFELGP